MPTYFVRERGLTLAGAASTFGLILVAAGFIGTLAGGRLSDALARRIPGAHFVLSGWSLVASLASRCRRCWRRRPRSSGPRPS
jgi:hypothetical protein